MRSPRKRRESGTPPPLPTLRFWRLLDGEKLHCGEASAEIKRNINGGVIYVPDSKHRRTTSHLTLHGRIHEVSVRFGEHDAMPPHTERLLIARRCETPTPVLPFPDTRITPPPHIYLINSTMSSIAIFPALFLLTDQ